MIARRRIQHYIPRFYLREFSKEAGDRSQVFCFDKKTGTKFLVSVDKVGAESYFYDIDGKQEVEQAFSELEGAMSGSYRALLESEDITELSKDDRILIALFIATQHMRTRDFRNIIKEATEYTLKHIRSLSGTEDKLSRERLERLTEEKPAKCFQFALLARSVPEFVAVLLQMKWILFINETKMPFWCSDTPFTYSNVFPSNKYDGLGFERVGSQTHFPLSPKLSLEIVDPLTYAGYPTIIHIDDTENVIFNNHLQVKSAQRHIFSPTNDFSLAEEMIEKNPQLRETDKNRFEIEVPKFHSSAP